MNPSLNRRRTLVLLLATAAVACSDSASEFKATELPPLEFRADTKDLLFTWIDDLGGTHPETSVGDIPEAHRELVRVVGSDEARAKMDPIYVADARKPDLDGVYTARSFARSAWEDEVSRRRREASPEALAALEPRGKRAGDRRSTPSPPTSDAGPEAPSERGGPSASPSSTATEKPAPFGSLVAIVYGAAWCGPCKNAKAHLAKRKVHVDYRDIDTDANARKEMTAKLGPRGRGGSIPVIDIRGRILVGYSARALDRAIDDALSKNTVL